MAMAGRADGLRCRDRWAIAQVIGNTRLIASQLLLHNATNATDYAAAAVRRRRAVWVCVFA